MLARVRGTSEPRVIEWPDGRYLTVALPAGKPTGNAGGLGWTVVVREPASTVFAPVQALRSRVLAWGTLCVVLAIIGGLLLAAWLSRPLRALADAVGDPQQVAALTNSRRYREIGVLSRAIVQVETALHAAKEEAERASAAKSSFLAAASHDLRQPLQSMFMFAGALESDVRPGPSRKKLDHLMRGMETMRALLDSLLDVSRLDTSAAHYSLEDFWVAELLEEIGSAYAPIAAAKGLMLEVAQCSSVVRSDRTMLGRMLRNLVENAVKYTEVGAVRVACQQQGGRLRIEVRDTGIGIAPDELACIWEEFHQVGNPERDRAKGLGLGLAIVRRLAQILDHPVTVSSVPGQGSVFAIDLPLGKRGTSVTASAPEVLT